MTIGEKIKELRKVNGYSQELIAEKIAVSRQTISKWENDLSIPSTNNLIKLANLFDVDIHFITNQNTSKPNDDDIPPLKNKSLYVFGAILCFFSFLIGIGFSDQSDFFIFIGVLAPMGLSYCLTELI